MMDRKTAVLGRWIAQSLVCGSTLLLAACGGEMPLSGQLKVAGDPPPPPPPPPPPKPEPPPEPPPRVEVRDNKIEIHEKIQFEYNKADIKEESFDLMNEITQVLKDNAHIKKVSIEGHTDSDGSDSYNLKLSDARSKSVMKYLVEHGVAEGRLTAQGFGESQPIGENETDEGKATNRRVEFKIVEQDVTQKKVQIDPRTGKETVIEKKHVHEKPDPAKPEATDETEKSDQPSLAKPKK